MRAGGKVSSDTRRVRIPLVSGSAGTRVHLENLELQIGTAEFPTPSI